MLKCWNDSVEATRIQLICETILYTDRGRGSLGVKVTDSCLVCHKFKPNTYQDSDILPLHDSSWEVHKAVKVRGSTEWPVVQA
ncbi:hypothetical protein TNCV_2950121 [Trichonephila clavipes]|nr:hypothetical protein TNCV_2950121 [Trichonephila clavipes]